jgi:hypothetical protein
MPNHLNLLLIFTVFSSYSPLQIAKLYAEGGRGGVCHSLSPATLPSLGYPTVLTSLPASEPHTVPNRTTTDAGNVPSVIHPFLSLLKNNLKSLISVYFLKQGKPETLVLSKTSETYLTQETVALSFKFMPQCIHERQHLR